MTPMAEFCTNCGAPLSGAFCGRCGHRAQSATAPAQSVAPAPQPIAAAQPVAAAPQPSFQQPTTPQPLIAQPSVAQQSAAPVPQAPAAQPPKSSGGGKALLIVGGIPQHVPYFSNVIPGHIRKLLLDFTSQAVSCQSMAAGQVFRRGPPPRGVTRSPSQRFAKVVVRIGCRPGISADSPAGIECAIATAVPPR